MHATSQFIENDIFTRHLLCDGLEDRL
jgi:hypothetical protein